MSETETERERESGGRVRERKRICKMESGRQVERKNEKINDRMKNNAKKKS
jgi:hypothetical protein